MRRLLLPLLAACSVCTDINAVDPKTAAGFDHTLVLTTEGTVWATGLNTRGQLGDGTTINKSNFVAVLDSTTGVALTGIKDVAAGQVHSVALSTNGEVYTWGSGTYGRLGSGNTSDRSMAAKITTNSLGQSFTNITAISSTADHTLALDANGNVWAWGYGVNGRLGDGTNVNRTVPVQVLHRHYVVTNGFGYTVILPLTNVVCIAAGSSHSVASTTNYLYAWGASPGNGIDADFVGYVNPMTWTIDEAYMPVAWPMDQPASQLMAGDDFTLFIPATNSSRGVSTVWGFGKNGNGQLGNNATRPIAYMQGWHEPPISDPAPVRAGTLTNVVQAIAGGNGRHSMALMADSTLFAWGNGAYGQLGTNGSTSVQKTPVQVLKSPGNYLSNVIAAAVGENHSVAITNGGGTAYFQGWGRHHNGQLGTGEYSWDDKPTAVPGVSDITAIASGPQVNFNLVLTSDEVVRSWGYNGTGQLGIGDNETRSNAVTIVTNFAGTLFTNVDAIATGQGFSLALSNGNVWAWGSGTSGRLGNGSTATRYSPVPIITNAAGAPFNAVTAISAGSISSVALMGGNVYSWGIGTSGQLGLGSTANKTVPNQIVTNAYHQPFDNISVISAGDNFCLAISNGTVWAWGQNSSGQLGISSTANQTSPVLITTNITGAPFTGIVDVVAGGNHSLALDSSGNLYAWGGNGSGQLGDNTTTARKAPTYVTNGVAAMAAGEYHSLILMTDGTVYAFGDNTKGQLGVGGTTDKHVPTLVPSLSNVTAIAAGQTHSLAIVNGQAIAWGDSANGENGDGNVGYYLLPVP